MREPRRPTPLTSETPPRSLEGYALWLCLADPEADRLEALIRATAEREGTPAFRPHLTLLGAMPGPEPLRSAQAMALARELHPLALNVTAVTAQADYYRGVVLEVGLTVELAEARSLAAATFAYALEPAYRPHVSLVYGELPVVRKAELAAELAHMAGSRLSATHLELVDVTGSPDRWRTATCLPVG